MRNEKSELEVKYDLIKLAIESVTQLLTLGLSNADKANERLHTSLTCENSAAVQAIAERELDLAESLFDRAFGLFERQMAVQEKHADARMKEAEASYLRAEKLSDSSAYSAGYAAAMAYMDEESEDDDVAAG